jgi:hypothetical protein
VLLDLFVIGAFAGIGMWGIVAVVRATWLTESERMIAVGGIAIVTSLLAAWVIFVWPAYWELISLPLRPARVHGVGPALKVHKEGVRVANFGETHSIRLTARHSPTVISRLKRSALDGDLSTLLAGFVGRLRVNHVVGPIGMLRGWRTDLPQHPPARGAGRHGRAEQAQGKGL